MSFSIDQRLGQARMDRIILPMQSDDPALRHVNAWLSAGQLLFDTGKDDPETRRVWQGLDMADGLIGICCTHAHPDHMGLAHHFAQRGEARIHVSDAEMETARAAFARTPAALALLRQNFLRDMGSLRPGASASRPLDGTPVIPPPGYSPLLDGQRLQCQGASWRVALGGGHSIRPALFIDEAHGLLITGDQILPDMTPYVGVDLDRPDADPLGTMLDFLRSWGTIDPDVIALPGHGAPFCDVGKRARNHILSYERRLLRAWTAAEVPLTGAELLCVLFRVAPAQQVLDIHYAMAAALLNHLVATGRMRKWREADGAFRFQRL